MFLDNILNYQEKADELKKIYNRSCQVCNGQGIISGDKGFTNCECTKKANIHARLLCNGMPKKYLTADLNSLKGVDINNINKLKEYCVNVSENMFNASNLFINGSDKLKIMELNCAIANDLAFKKNYKGYFHNILFISVEELTQTINMIRNNMEQKNKLQKVLADVDILILNYLGDETDTRSEQTSKYLNNLFTQRAFNEKITILSSELNIEEMANKYGAHFINIIKQNFKLIKLQNNINNEEFGDDTNGYY